jgi:hypothetical protein
MSLLYRREASSLSHASYKMAWYRFAKEHLERLIRQPDEIEGVV